MGTKSTKGAWLLGSLAVLASSLLVPGEAQAQRMAGRVAIHPNPPTARPRVLTTRPYAARTTRAANAGSLGPGFLGSGSFGNGFSTLKDGFGRDIGVEAVIDPATQWRIATAERLARFRGSFAGSGFYFLNGGYPVIEDEASGDPTPYPARTEPILVIQQPPEEQAAPPRKEVAPATNENAPPLPDVGQFTLVLRSGAKIQAIGFTRMGDRIVYITAEGTRRTMAIADLDTNATRQVNEERGTPLQLPL